MIPLRSVIFVGDGMVLFGRKLSLELLVLVGVIGE